MLESLFYLIVFFIFLVLIIWILKKVSSIDDSVGRKKRAERNKLHAKYSTFVPTKEMRELSVEDVNFRAITRVITLHLSLMMAVVKN